MAPCAAGLRLAACLLVLGVSALVPPPRGGRRLKTEVRVVNEVLPMEGVASGLAGGAIGVFGSIMAIELKKAKLVRAKQCPYCTGIGNLMCASCCGSGKNAMDSTSSTATQCQCATCSGQGSISCQNCMGRGQFIPTILDVTVSRDPESAYEAIGLQ